MAPACPPGRSRVHTPRGRPSATATSAGSASGSPARRRRTGLTPGSSSPAGRLCVKTVSTESTDSVRGNCCLRTGWILWKQICSSATNQVEISELYQNRPGREMSVFQCDIVTIKSQFQLQTTRPEAKSFSCHCEISDDVRSPESFQVCGPPALAPRPHTPLHKGSR